MDITEIAASQVANAAALTQQKLSIAMAKQAAEAQAQLANVIEQQTKQPNPSYGFSVYA